jgi:hypothetical protein
MSQKYLDSETVEIVEREDAEGGINIVFQDGRKRGIEKWDEQRFLPIESQEASADKTEVSA